MLFIFNFLFSPLPTPALICLLTFGTAIFLWLINRPQPVLPLIDLDNQSVGIEGGARRGAFQKNNDLILYYFSDAKTLYENFQRGLAVSGKPGHLALSGRNPSWLWFILVLSNCLLHPQRATGYSRGIKCHVRMRVAGKSTELSSSTSGFNAPCSLNLLSTQEETACPGLSQYCVGRCFDSWIHITFIYRTSFGNIYSLQ